MMKSDEVNIREPYLLIVDGTYYLYGTRSETCRGKADGFDCYRSGYGREGDGLYLLWSSWGTAGYAVGAARSESGSVKGPWIQQEEPVSSHCSGKTDSGEQEQWPGWQ